MKADFFLRKPTSLPEFKELVDMIRTDLQCGKAAILCGVFGQEIDNLRSELESKYTKFIYVNSPSEIHTWLYSRNMNVGLIVFTSRAENIKVEQLISEVRKEMTENSKLVDIAYVSHNPFKLIFC